MRLTYVIVRKSECSRAPVNEQIIAARLVDIFHSSGFDEIFSSSFRECLLVTFPHFGPAVLPSPEDDIAYGYKGPAGMRDQAHNHFKSVTRTIAHLFVEEYKRYPTAPSFLFGPSAAWRFLATSSQLTAALPWCSVLSVFLPIAGSRLQQCYGKQFSKLVRNMLQDGGLVAKMLIYCDAQGNPSNVGNTRACMAVDNLRTELQKYM